MRSEFFWYIISLIQLLSLLLLFILGIEHSVGGISSTITNDEERTPIQSSLTQTNENSSNSKPDYTFVSQGLNFLLTNTYHDTSSDNNSYSDPKIEFTDDKIHNFMIGTGIYDITGPAAQINFMGYALPSQTGHGIHLRLRSRAFIISESITTTTTTTTTRKSDIDFITENNNNTWIDYYLEENSTSQQRRRRKLHHSLLHDQQESSTNDTDNTETETSKQSLITNSTTICFVSIDACMGSDLITQRVLQKLEELRSREIDPVDIPCTIDNLSISGEHTHSASGGFLQYALYQVTSAGFSEEVIGTYVQGVVQSLVRAYNTLQIGSIELTQGLLLNDASINRSPTSYLLNPQDERDEYESVGGNIDKNMLQLNFRSIKDDTPIGLLNWFAVHPTSMNKTNTLISSDNKGYAGYLTEKFFNGNATFPGHGSFVAAFGSTNFGDVSPNTAGPHCLDTGKPCDVLSSSCNGNALLCVASGPGKNMKESTEIIGRKQHHHAIKLWNLRNQINADNYIERPRSINNYNGPIPSATYLDGKVQSRHSFIHITNLNVTLPNGEIVETCPGALGYSFAAGTTDGPGEYPFVQGTNTSNRYLDIALGLFSTPSPQQVKCHSPKPILLNAGDVNIPYQWLPDIVPISIFQVGTFYILNVPGEFTTMAGRRLKKAVREVLMNGGIKDPHIAIAGLANAYSHYVTTFEEYAGQRYEAGCTLYGPHTLSAYIQEFRRIATDLVNNVPSTTFAHPKDYSRKQISLIEPAKVDLIGLGYSFGSVSKDANDSYKVGETVKVSFRSANPRHNQRIEGTFLTVDKMISDNATWESIYVDGDWCTEFHWHSDVDNWGTSFVDVVWDIPIETSTGLYRVCHYGTRRTVIGSIISGLFHIPGILTSSIFGSTMIDIIWNTVEFTTRFSSKFKTYYEELKSTSKFRDFHGCSRTFLVHS